MAPRPPSGSHPAFHCLPQTSLLLHLRFINPLAPYLLCHAPALPQATKWLTPGFLQPAVQWVENTALWWGMPPVRLAAGAMYGSISFVDHMVRTACRTCVRAEICADKKALAASWVGIGAGQSPQVACCVLRTPCPSLRRVIIVPPVEPRSTPLPYRIDS